MDEDLSESSGKHVLGELGGTVTNVGHFVDALEAPPHPVVNTFGLPPVPLELIIAIRLVARELLRALLDNLGTVGRSYRHGGAERLTQNEAVMWRINKGLKHRKRVKGRT